MNKIYADYRIDHAYPPPYEKEESNAPYHVASVSLVRNMDKPFEEFTDSLEQEITSWPQDTLLGVLPEFCWRQSTPQEVFGYLDVLKSAIRPNLALVLGTLEFTLNGKYTNNAIVLYDSKFWFIPKYKVITGDIKQGLVSGENPGVIALPRFNLAVLVCADLWDARLSYKLAIEEKADIFAVPAWTATTKGNRKYTKQDWLSLARTRSTEYSITVMVADHLKNYPKTDVGNATANFTPANRREEFPLDSVERKITFISPEVIRQAKQRWQEKGLAQSK